MLRFFFINLVTLFMLNTNPVAANDGTLKLPAIFADNMVLQQNHKCKVWGETEPGRTVLILSSWGVQSQTIAGSDGQWMTEIMTISSGGPHTITIQSGSENKVIRNVLLGEVWLASGQSNMEMPLAGWPPDAPILNSAEEIAGANFSGIRFFTVSRTAAVIEQTDCPGRWQICSPQTAPDFSATAFFFAKHLHQTLNVPVGILHSSWGGTPVQSWMDIKHLSRFEEYRQIEDRIAKSLSRQTEYDKWLANLRQIKLNLADPACWTDLDFGDQHLAGKEFNETDWHEIQVPGGWEYAEPGRFDGVIWFRKGFVLPEAWKNMDLVLELGPIDDMDITYVNGVRIGANQGDGLWQKERVYTIDKSLLLPGENKIAVRVLDNTGGGGMYGSPDKLKIYPSGHADDMLSLAGTWKYLPVAEYMNGVFYIFNFMAGDFYQRPELPVESGPFMPGSLYNGMIHPLIPFTLQGAIWYQGESNAGEPELYTKLFPGMIQNWREDWGQGDFSFNFVQLAPFDYGSQTASQKLREAQFKTLSVANTGMAVTVDIGDPLDVHPADKGNVGYRLALWALSRTYGKNLVYSGPLYKEMEIDEGRIIVRFEHIGSGLVLKQGMENHFLVAGEDRVFHSAQVRIEGNRLIVSHPEISKPVAVRYLWDNTSAATLFNVEGLPASGFRTDDWK